jgi:hypothetical protein
VIRRISAGFVPVAVNLYKVRAAKDAGGALFRSVQKQRDQYQGIWIVAPDGQVLAGHHEVKDHKSWTREVLATIDDALKAFGPVTRREAGRVAPLPYRGLGVRPDGGITLAITVRYTYAGRPEGDGVIDSLTLPEADWAGLTPPVAGGSRGWTVPEPVARRFSRILSPNSDQSTMPRPEEVTAVRLAGRVLAIEDGRVRLAYEGTIAASHTYEGKVSHAEARLTGAGSYEVKSGRLLSFLLVADGTYRMAPPYDKDLRTTAAAVEWRRGPKRPAR